MKKRNSKVLRIEEIRDEEDTGDFDLEEEPEVE